MLSGCICDLLGRKKALLLELFLSFVSMVIIGTAKTYHGLLVGRAVHGFCYGSIISIVTIYNSEICQPKIRNYSGAFCCTCMSLSYAPCFVLDLMVNWRQLVLISSGLSMVNFLLLLIFVPESPTWYITKERIEEAKEALKTLRGNEEAVKAEFERTYNQVKEERRHTSNGSTLKSHLALFRQPIFTKPCLTIIAMITFGNVLSGMGAVCPYFNLIMIKIGPPINPSINSLAIMLCRIIAAFLGLILMKHFKRKTLYVVSGTLMVTANLLIFSQLKYDFSKLFNVDNHFFSWLPIIGLFMLVCSYAGGVGHVVYALQGELLPAHGRGFGSGLASMCMSLSMFILTKMLPAFEHVVGISYIFLISALCVLTIVLIDVYFVPETKDKNLEDIASYYRGQPDQKKEMDENES